MRVRFNSNDAERNVILDPGLKLGEEFMDGGYVVEAGSIYDFLRARSSPTSGRPTSTWWMIANARSSATLTRRLRQINTPLRAKRNVARHYDLDGRLYSLFLDNDLQYSCAYFEDGRHRPRARRSSPRSATSPPSSRSSPGMRVLDIGSGWGGLGLYLAERCRRRRHRRDAVGGAVRGLEPAGRASAASPTASASCSRTIARSTGPFDRIVSVGMFEHVGVNHYRAFFDACRDLLTPDGVMVLHSIGRFDGPGDTNAWIQKYIFPGGYIPAISEVHAGDREGRAEDHRHRDPAAPLRQDAAAPGASASSPTATRSTALYDERFCRMWEFYLAASETSFRYQDMMNFQIQLTKHQDALPLTRDYMWEAEEALRLRITAPRAAPRSKIAGE